jgi:hypothetical protein
LAARFGYLDYDMDELDSWVRNDLYPQLKARVEGGLESPENSFGVFLNENLANTLVVTHSSRDAMEEENRGMRGPRPSLRDLDPYVKRLPRDRIVMRYELKTRTLYVSVRAFQDWCRKSRVSDTAVLYALRRERVWGGMKKRRVLGQCVPTLPPTSVTCYVFSLAGSEYDPGSGTRG